MLDFFLTHEPNIIMKQQILTLLPPLKFYTNRTMLWGFLPLAFISLLLLSVSSSNVNSSSFLSSISSGGNGNEQVAFFLNEVPLEDSYVEEAVMIKMEQTKSVFSKVLNLSLVDGNGNLVALSLTDLENGGIGDEINSNLFYGNEHKNVNQNFSIDLGSIAFTNNSSLILEQKDGTSLISRNGWIKIVSCKDGMISGSFHFEVNASTVSEGEFIEVKYEVEG